MKLTDIVVLEAAPLGDDPAELKDVVKYFPNQHKKAINAFMNNGRLHFGGDQLFTKDGENGPALNDAIRVAERFIKHEKVEITVNFDVRDTELELDRDKTHYEFEAEVADVKEVWVGYNTKTNDLLLGFDVWLDEESFNEEWDNNWDDAFDFPFDMDNEEHEKVFNRAWKKYSQNQFFGGLVEVNSGMHASMDMPFMENGFHRGTYKVLKKDHIIELSL